ncbi:Pyridoxal 4-dehydrogenase [Apiospora kogelbergensis]|uniref:Pyridoxal 4-dehydrogenase n=1 Tax=Apiospora kogelbergensis TaxID=1337665 RepID=UPI003131E4BF
MKFEDKVVLVTGASRGLGAAIARAFAAEGARVVVNYKQNRELAEAVASEIRGHRDPGGRYRPSTGVGHVPANRVSISRPRRNCDQQCTSPFEFNGDAARPRLAQVTWAAFDQQLQGAVRGALNTTQAALPRFSEIGSGRIINIGSNLVANPVVPYQDYTAAKGALLAFTRTCAAELGPRGITCNMVSGGLLRTTDASRSTPDAVFDQVAAAAPLRKVATPEDVAGAVMFFASDWASAITGQNLNVDGGLVMS